MQLRNLALYTFFALALFSVTTSHAKGELDAIKDRIKTQGELAPLPEAKPLLVELAKLLNSKELARAIANSPSLQIMRKDLHASLFHLNFVFEVENADYPYEPPFSQPFPFRPTLAAMDEAIQFLEIVQKTTGFRTNVLDQLTRSEFFSALPVLFPKIKDQGIPSAIPKTVIVHHPVDTYNLEQARLKKYGEIASFAMYEADVDAVLNALRSPESQKRRELDRAYDLACGSAIYDLEVTKSLSGGEATRLQSAFGVKSPFPYRRTIEAIFKGLSVLDMHQRLTYPESNSWHEVEFSWQKGQDEIPKLLALYHFNRYKYQLAGLLADPEIVLWLVSINLTENDLFRLSAAPWGLIGVITKVQRGDRHYNTSKDYAYHDVNHVRRIWAYLKAKLKQRGAKTRAQKIAVFKEQEAFILKILTATEPVPGDEHETELRKVIRILSFETLHETARPPDRESMLYDLRRTPGTRQPFEVQLQAKIDDIESMRAFDGNLQSGADKLTLNLEIPTVIRYFWDRAPGYLANVDNKLRWGFYDSVFEVANSLVDIRYRTPAFLAKAAARVFEMLGAENPFTHDEMVQMINDRSGQPELWAYFDLHDRGLVNVTGVHAFQTLTAGALHKAWRLGSTRKDRWLPSDAKLANGAIVNNESRRRQYLEEKLIPNYLHHYYKIDKHPVTGALVLFEDILHLPHEYLAPNHQINNMLSSAKGISLVDRIWQNQIQFKTIAQAIRWIKVACESIHQAFINLNATGSKSNPEQTVPWVQLSKDNKINDLEIVRIAFDARVEHDQARKNQGQNKFMLSNDQITMFREAIMQLRQEIMNEAPVARACVDSLTTAK